MSHGFGSHEIESGNKPPFFEESARPALAGAFSEQAQTMKARHNNAAPDNDNTRPRPPSGKAARSWPAMERARAGRLFPHDPDRNGRAIEALEAFAALVDLATLDYEAIPSSTGSREGMALNDNEDAFLPESGFGIDRYLDVGPTPERLVALAEAGRVVFRPERVWPLLIRDRTSGKLHEVRERLRQPAGPEQQTAAERDAAVMAWTRTVHPSKKSGGGPTPRAPLGRRLAFQRIEAIEARIGSELLKGIYRVACEHWTAMNLGLAAGLRHKPAEAKGGALMAVYADAAICALLDAANDDKAKPLKRQA